MVMRSITVALGLLVTLLSVPSLAPSVALADSLTQTYTQVRPSIVLIVNTQEKSIGSGFVVSSDSSGSDILTAAHVVGAAEAVQVYINSDVSVAYRAKVVRTDKTHDLALIHLSKGNLPAATIASSASEGNAIATAGYPIASMDFLVTTNELKPSLHEGVISAVRLGGMIIEHSAVTDHGNSGGPIFEADSGYVVGVVLGVFKNTQGAYVGAGYKSINDFLASSGVKTPESYETSAVLTNVPGAYHILLVHHTAAEDATTSSLRANIDSRVLSKVLALFPGAQIIRLDDSPSDMQTARAACEQHPAVGLIYIDEGWQYTAPPNAFVYPRVSAQLAVQVSDCYFSPIWGAHTSKDVKSNQYDGTAAVLSSMNDLADQIVGAIKTVISADQTVPLNFLRYGYAIGDGKKKVFAQLKPSATGATVSYVAPYSPAARAGLSQGTNVASVNGQSTIGLSVDALAKLQTDINNGDGKYSVVVQNPDGTTATIEFQARDIRWYLSHPLP